ncbi:MAG TPA: glycerate kinase [bacterium]|nr:glycerate kinase [bacterium]
MDRLTRTTHSPRARSDPALRRTLGRIIETAVAAVEPGAAVRRAVRRRGSILRIGAKAYHLDRLRRILVIGAGKAAAPMAAAFEEILGARVTGGLVSVKDGHTAPLRRVELVEAGHPLPDARGQRAAERIFHIAQDARAGDLVLCVISGGGSALLPAPVEGLSLQDKIALTDLLLRSGATIQEVNAVRKHLSQLKGGRLAKAAYPAHLAVLVLSDVIGNPLDAIASGPAAPDPTTFADALEIVQRYGINTKMPAVALDHLRRGAAGEIPDTPKPRDPAFRRVHTVIIGSNEHAARAAAVAARREGYRTLLLTSSLEGEAREAGRLLASMARGAQDAGLPFAPPACLIAGGETTVTVRGNGKGGRCQEFALSAALSIAGRSGVLIAAFGTDGTDGPTDAAGALTTGDTLDRAAALGLDARTALAENDAYPFFHGLGDLIVTGPTNTNVNDLYLALVGRPGRVTRREQR